MKKIIIICLLASGLFASDICLFASKQVTKSLKILNSDLENKDYESFSINYESFKLYVDMAILNCGEEDTEHYLGLKKMIGEAARKVK